MVASQPAGYAALFFGARGRFSRTQAWVGFAVCVFLTLAGSLTFQLFGTAMCAQGVGALFWPSLLLGTVADIYVVYLLVTIGIRRCHDRDRRGWWLVLGFTGLGIPVLVFELGLLPGTIGPNRFGPDPLQDSDAMLRAFDQAPESMPRKPDQPTRMTGT